MQTYQLPHNAYKIFLGTEKISLKRCLYIHIHKYIQATKMDSREVTHSTPHRFFSSYKPGK